MAQIIIYCSERKYSYSSTIPENPQENSRLVEATDSEMMTLEKLRKGTDLSLQIALSGLWKEAEKDLKQP
jgi:hypothetical protein